MKGNPSEAGSEPKQRRCRSEQADNVGKASRDFIVMRGAEGYPQLISRCGRINSKEDM